MTLDSLLHLVAIFFAGICAGGWVLVLVALVPAKRALPPGAALHVHQVTTEWLDRYLPACTIIAIMAGVLVLARSPGHSAIPTCLTGGGAMGLLGAALISLRWNMPANRRLAGWTAAPVPEEYRSLQQRWDRTHAIRTACGLIAFLCYTAAALMA
jgi:hypothetical protein